MRVINASIAVVLIIAMVACTGSFSVPRLFSFPNLMSSAGQTMGVPAQVADETFTLSVSGNVYFDRIPVNGAEVSVYLNGQLMARTTAGDVYMFKVPGVRNGDTIRVDATYQGYTGSNSKVVKFKTTSMDVNIRSDRSFIRTALELFPTSTDMTQSGQQQQPQQTATTPTGSGQTTTAAPDANQLSSQIFGNTYDSIGNMALGSGNWKIS